MMTYFEFWTDNVIYCETVTGGASINYKFSFGREQISMSLVHTRGNFINEARGNCGHILRSMTLKGTLTATISNRGFASGGAKYVALILICKASGLIVLLRV